jgi:hypothetical protein
MMVAADTERHCEERGDEAIRDRARHGEAGAARWIATPPSAARDDEWAI